MAGDNQPNHPLAEILGHQNAKQCYDAIIKQLRKDNPGNLAADHPIAQFERRVGAVLTEVEQIDTQIAPTSVTVEKMKKLVDDISEPMSAICDLRMYDYSLNDNDSYSTLLSSFMPDEYDRTHFHWAFQGLHALQHRMRNIETMTSPTFANYIQNHDEPQYRWGVGAEINLPKDIWQAYHDIDDFMLNRGTSDFNDTANDLIALEVTIANFRDGKCDLNHMVGQFTRCADRFDTKGYNRSTFSNPLEEVEAKLVEYDGEIDAQAKQRIPEAVEEIRAFQRRIRKTAQALGAEIEQGEKKPGPERRIGGAGGGLQR